MKKFILILFVSVFSFQTFSQVDTAHTGLLYGYNHSYYLSAPIGWILDSESGKDQGLDAVFYPKGSTWADAETVMYTTFTSFDTTKHETLKEVIASDSVNFKLNSPKLSINKQEPISISKDKNPSKDKNAIVYNYSGDVNGNYETVAYITEKKGVSMIILSSRNKNGCINNYKAFESLVKSYKFLTDNVNIQVGK